VDELTGVANRRGFEEELPRALARAMRSETPLCVAMLDLDGLKAINDSSGHQAGSAAIKQAAAAWASLLRETDVIARFGGDEFAVILPGSSLDAAAIVAERLRVAIESHRASVSIGVAQWDGDEAMDQLIERADEALYEAKRGGRDRVITASAF
jgi:diguanylate cyclase (GGDEF)-like protein